MLFDRSVRNEQTDRCKHSFAAVSWIVQALEVGQELGGEQVGARLVPGLEPAQEAKTP
jgi:hypothetical protein